MMQALRNILLVTLLAAAGCEKSSNVTAMQDETAALANQYRSRFEELTKRYQLIDKAKKGDIDQAKDVKNLWAATGKRLGELRNAAAQAQNAVAAAMKSPNPSADLIRLQSDLRERLQRGETEVTANLHAVESWLSMRAYAPKTVASADSGTAAGAARGSEPDKPDMHKQDSMGQPDHPQTPKTGLHPDDKHDALKADDAKKDGPKADPKTDVKKDATKADAPPKADAKADAKKDAPKKDAPKTGSGSAR